MKKGTGLQQNCCKVSDYQLGPALKKNPYTHIYIWSNSDAHDTKTSHMGLSAGVTRPSKTLKKLTFSDLKEWPFSPTDAGSREG